MLNNNIWSKGPIDDDYSKKKTKTSSSEREIINMMKIPRDVIFIRCGPPHLMDLDLFSNNLNILTTPVTLITSDGDRSVPSSYNKQVVDNILNNINVKTWYTQNYDMTIIHDKLKHYPIGFDFHTLPLLNNSIKSKFMFMIECRRNSPTDERINDKIFCDFHHHYSHFERGTLHNKFRYNKHFKFNPFKTSFKIITERYNKFNFAISPRGNGLDCHRTWELLLAGVIVITKTSPLDYMFINNNLPVVILNDWSELDDNLENKLKDWYEQNIDKTAIDNIFPKLIFKYWIK